MQRLEVSGAVRSLWVSLGVKVLSVSLPQGTLLCTKLLPHMRKCCLKVGKLRLSFALSVRMQLKGIFVLEFEEGVQSWSCAAFSVVSLIHILQKFSRVIEFA